MHRIILILIAACGVIQVRPQNVNLENILFSRTTPIVYDTLLETTTTSQLKCKTVNNLDGYCVAPALCKNGTINTSGARLIRTRGYNPCPVSDNVCCVLSSDPQTSSSSITPATPTIPAPVVAPTPLPQVTQSPTLPPISRPVNPPVSNPPRTNLPSVTRKAKKGCGWRQELSIGGRKFGSANPLFGEFPWTVAVFRVEDDGSETFLCGGSLLGPRVVLTDAINFQREHRWRVRAGDYDIIRNNEVRGHQSRDVSKVITHDDFNSGSFSNNIGLLILSSDISLAGNIAFICLPSASEIAADGSKCIATGWGDAVNPSTHNIGRVMKMVNVPVVNRNSCQNILRAELNSGLELDNSQLCAGGEAGVDVCRGDGGSPLVCEYLGTKGRYYLSGIVSFGAESCGKAGIPSVYTNVASLRSWIDTALAAENIPTNTFTP